MNRPIRSTSMFRRMIPRLFMVHQFGLIRPIIIQAMCRERGWHLARESYWEQRGRTIGAIAIGVMATSTSITKTTSTKTRSIEEAIELTLIVASKAENGSIMRSIAVALLTETETQLTSTAAALDNSQPAELADPALRRAPGVERVLPEEQAIEAVAEEPGTSERVIAPVGGAEREAVRAI